ncbi:MAG: hypothetical protein NT106_08920 [Candidatus Sumerlaeota bacterium]|nr:hypothetical protein [Candidatus Sumerlaeota bacterium]
MPKRICVVAAGRWGKNHVKTLQGMGCLAGIVEPEETALKELGLLYPHVTLFNNIRDAINGDFDGFSIATPAETQFEIARFILEHTMRLNLPSYLLIARALSNV